MMPKGRRGETISASFQVVLVGVIYLDMMLKSLRPLIIIQREDLSLIRDSKIKSINLDQDLPLLQIEIKMHLEELA